MELKDMEKLAAESGAQRQLLQADPGWMNPTEMGVPVFESTVFSGL